MENDNPIIVQCSNCGKSERLKKMQALPLSKERLVAAYRDVPVEAELAKSMQGQNALLIALPVGWVFRYEPIKEVIEIACSLDCVTALEEEDAKGLSRQTPSSRKAATTCRGNRYKPSN